MAYKINRFLLCTEGKHNKIWGYVTLGEPGSSRLYNFWGKVGAKLGFQEHNGNFDTALQFHKQAEEKCRPGRKSGTYKAIPIDQIENHFPGWIESFEKQLTLAKLFESWRGKKEDE